MRGYGQFRTRRSRSVDLSVLSSFNHRQSPHPHLSTAAAPKAKETATQFAVFNVKEDEEEAGAGAEAEEDEQNVGRVVLCRRKSCASTEKVLKGDQLRRAFSMRRVSSVSFSRGAAKWGSYSRIHDQIEVEPSPSPIDGVSKAKSSGKILTFCKRLLGLKY